jgi:hypothetical protein
MVTCRVRNSNATEVRRPCRRPRGGRDATMQSARPDLSLLKRGGTMTIPRHTRIERSLRRTRLQRSSFVLGVALLALSLLLGGCDAKILDVTSVPSSPAAEAKEIAELRIEFDAITGTTQVALLPPSGKQQFAGHGSVFVVLTPPVPELGFNIFGSYSTAWSKTTKTLSVNLRNTSGTALSIDHLEVYNKNNVESSTLKKFIGNPPYSPPGAPIGVTPTGQLELEWTIVPKAGAKSFSWWFRVYGVQI